MNQLKKHIICYFITYRSSIIFLLVSLFLLCSCSLTKGLLLNDWADYNKETEEWRKNRNKPLTLNEYYNALWDAYSRSRNTSDPSEAQWWNNFASSVKHSHPTLDEELQKAMLQTGVIRVNTDFSRWYMDL